MGIFLLAVAGIGLVSLILVSLNKNPGSRVFRLDFLSVGQGESTLSLNKNPGDRVFRLAPQQSRGEFLLRAFEIKRQDCESLHFDGRNFHHSKEIPYEKYCGIRVAGSVRTTVRNSSLPHTVSWKYQRANGGPDCRYHGNSKTMHSERHFVHFDGMPTFTLHAYSKPGYWDLEQSVKKFDKFICGAQERDYEDYYKSYHFAYESKNIAQSELDRITSILASCDEVLSAYNKLPDLTNISDELKIKSNDAAKKRKEIMGRIEQLRLAIAEQEQTKTLAVHAAQAQSDVAVSHRTISRF